MPPRPPQTSQQSANNAATGSDDRNPFLKAEHVQNGDVFTLTGWTRRLTGRFGEQIIIEGTLDRVGRMYDFGIGVGSPNHRKLFKGMGKDETTWEGKLTLGLGKGRSGNHFVEIRSVDSNNPPF